MLTPTPAADGTTFGRKTIGVLGSLSMLLNNILGPGVANFPGIYQSAGWLTPTLLILICSVSSLAAGEMLAAAMRGIPGNGSFEKRVEYSTLCSYYFRPCAAKCGVIVFLLAMMTANIGNIIQTAHVLDETVDALFSDSCAVELYPRVLHFFCHTDPGDVTPFGTGKVLISLGTTLVALCSVPLSYWNLDDNIVFQNSSLIFILISFAMWIMIFFTLGLQPSRTPVLRYNDGLGAYNGVFGTVLFNFMFISTLPSWICEKKPQVLAGKVILWTLLVAGALFWAVGWCGGMAFQEYYKTDNTLFSELHHMPGSKERRFLAALAVNIYAIASNIASIPIFSIMLRYNIMEQRLLGKRAAGLVSVVLPWGLSVLLYCGSGFLDLVSFAGTFASSIVNFVIPSLFFIASQRRTQQCLDEGSISCSTQEMTQSGSDLAAPVNCEACHDMSGHFTSSQQRRRWLRIAWLNIVVMVALASVSILEQLPGH